MTALAEAFVALRSDDTLLRSDVRRDAGRAADDAGTVFGKRFSGKAKAGIALAGVGLFAGIGSALRTGAGEVKDYQTGLSNLQAGLKSTGGVAGLTADDMENLASRVQDYSGQTDDSIVATEQLLLTFTNVRNEAGKNNDVFTQTVEIAADMAQRMGGDASSAAIQLGKALQDPVKGIAALHRVGVDFDDQQTARITSLAENNHLLGAQKIILAELRKEFGGSARAFGATDAGSINKATREWEDLSQELTTELLPAFRGTIGAIRDTTGFIQENESWLKPLAVTLGVVIASWKLYTLTTKAAAAANLFFAGTAATAGTAAAAEGAAVGLGGAAGVAGRAGGLGLGKAIPLVGAGVAAFELTTAGLHSVFGDRFGKDAADPTDNLTSAGKDLVSQYGSVDAALTALRAENAATEASEGGLTKAHDRHSDSLRREARELAATQHSSLDLSGGMDSLRQAVHNMAVTVGGQSSRALNGNSDAALANRDALRGAVSSALDYVDALKAGDTPRRHVLDQEKSLADAIERNASETYGNKKAVDRLLRSLGFMPGQIQAVIDKYRELHEVAFNPQQGTGKNSPFLDPGHPGFVPPAAKSAAESAAKKDGKDLGQAVLGGYSDVVDPGIAAATKAATDAAHQALQAAKSRMRSDFQSIKQAFASEKQTLISAFGSLSSDQRVDSLGAAFGGPVSVNAQLRADAKQMETFARLWTRLDDKHLDPRLLAQFAGPEYIPAMRELLRGGRHDIRVANRLEGRIARSAGQVAADATENQYGRQIHHDMVTLPKKIGNELADKIRGLHINVNITEIDKRDGVKIRHSL